MNLGGALMLKLANRLCLVFALLLLGCTQRETPAPRSETVDPSPAAVEETAAEKTSTDAQLPASLPDAQAIPGERVGPITAETTYEDLVARFGEDRLQTEDVHVGEGFTQPGTRVDLGDKYSFSILWRDRDRTAIEEVRNFGTAWKTPEGIGIGTSFSELQEILGPFQLYGFAWDYEGTLSLKDTQLTQYDSLLFLRARPEESTVEQLPNDYQAVMGDGRFPSTNPHMEALSPRIYEMIVRFPPFTVE